MPEAEFTHTMPAGTRVNDDVLAILVTRLEVLAAWLDDSGPEESGLRVEGARLMVGDALALMRHVTDAGVLSQGATR